jgi:hypothetical protein
LRALLGEPSKSMGRGECFRFMSSANPSGKCIGAVGPRIRRFAVPTVDPRRSLSSPSSTLRVHSGEAQYGMFLSHNHGALSTLSPSSSRPQESSSKSSSREPKYLARHYWRPPDKLQKVCPHVWFHVTATRWLKALLFCRCKTQPTGRDWLRGRGGWERDDGLFNRQADARASDDAGRSAPYFEYKT